MLDENRAKSVLQIDALVLVAQFIDININRMDKPLNQISADVIGFAVRLI